MQRDDAVAFSRNGRRPRPYIVAVDGIDTVVPSEAVAGGDGGVAIFWMVDGEGEGYDGVAAVHARHSVKVDPGGGEQCVVPAETVADTTRFVDNERSTFSTHPLHLLAAVAVMSGGIHCLVPS